MEYVEHWAVRMPPAQRQNWVARVIHLLPTEPLSVAHSIVYDGPADKPRSEKPEQRRPDWYFWPEFLKKEIPHD
jgi:hypothetical protein